MLHTVLCRLFTPVQTVLIVLALVNSRQESEKSIKMVWQPFLFQCNYGYRYVTRNHHPQNNLRVSYPGYVVSMIYGIIEFHGHAQLFIQHLLVFWSIKVAGNQN